MNLFISVITKFLKEVPINIEIKVVISLMIRLSSDEHPSIMYDFHRIVFFK